MSYDLQLAGAWCLACAALPALSMNAAPDSTRHFERALRAADPATRGIIVRGMRAARAVQEGRDAE